MNEGQNPVDLARKVIERDKSLRAQACEREITAALERYGCTFDVHLIPSGQGMWGYRLEVRANERG